jgi:multiple sugar transport system substrate-binding protein
MKATRITVVLLTTLFLLAGAMISMASGNGDGKGEKMEKVTITVQMFSGPEFDAMVPTAEYWNENYAEETGITVNAIAGSRVGYFEKMQSQLVAGLSEPDIVHPFNMFLGKLQPYLEPLDDYFAQDWVMSGPEGMDYSIDMMLPVALETGTGLDGKIYMLPKDMSEVILYYRTDVVPTPPETYEEFVEIAKENTQSLNPNSPTKYGCIVQGKYELWTFCAGIENLWPLGYEIFNPGTTTVAPLHPDTHKGFQFFQDLYESGVLHPGVENTEYPEVAAALESGAVSMAIQWNANYFSATNCDNAPKVCDKIDIAPPPGYRNADGSVDRAIYVQTICLALNKASEKKEPAAKFLAWSCFGEGAQLYAEAGGSSPVKHVWLADDAMMPYPKLAPMVMEYGRPFPVYEHMSEIVMIGSSWIQKVLIGRASAEEAAEGMQEEFADFVASKK